MASLSVDQALSKANLHLKSGMLVESEKLFRSVLSKFPKNTRAIAGLNEVMLLVNQQGKLEPAPTQFEALHHLYFDGKFQELGQKVEALLIIYPRSAGLYTLCGAAYAALKQFDSAIRCYTYSLQLNADRPETHFNLAVSLNETGETDAAIESYTKAIKLDPNYTEAKINLGNLQADLGDFAAAIQNFKQALELTPDAPLLHWLLGRAYSNNGDEKSAIGCFETALRLDPEYAECYRNYVMAVRRDVPDALVDKMRELIKNENRPQNDLMHLAFALSTIEEDRGNHFQSLAYLRQANKIGQLENKYTLSSDANTFSEVKSFFKDDFKDEQTTHFKRTPQRPIFILGMPRSGTSLVEQIVSGHSGVFGAGELKHLAEIIHESSWRTNPSRANVFQTIRSKYLAEIKKLSKSPVITDKMPANFRWIGFILHALPEAKIVYLKRDPAAVCWSIYKLFLPAKGLAYSFDLQYVARYFLLQREWMEFWERKFPGKIHVVDYEKLTEEPEAEARKLFDYLDLEWEGKVLNFHTSDRVVRTASNQQVRQKMYTGSSQQWKKYEPWIGKMLEILKPVM